MDDELLLRLSLRVKLDQLLLRSFQSELCSLPAFSYSDVVSKNSHFKSCRSFFNLKNRSVDLFIYGYL